MIHIAMAQINSTVGDLAYNQQAILSAAAQAHQHQADILLTPELSLCGYIPQDRLFQTDFLQAVEDTLQNIIHKSTEWSTLFLIVGHPLRQDGKLYNAASVIHNGQQVAVYCKHVLPNYSVFDEKRYFAEGTEFTTFVCKGYTVGLAICEDLWSSAVPQALKADHAELLLSLNASPFERYKPEQRYHRVQEQVTPYALPTVYVNTVGAQDHLLFDGNSFVLGPSGDVFTLLPAWAEAMTMVTFTRNEQGDCVPEEQRKISAEPVPLEELHARPSVHKTLYQALVFALKDYLRKNRFTSVWIGLSGGMDSALVLAIAVDALGADAVHTVMMPSVYTSDMSLADAQEMAQKLGVHHQVLPIEPLTSAFAQVLAAPFQGKTNDTTEENIQARVRGTLLMALSNKMGGVVLATGNKSELAMGYCTLYGDMCGSYALIKDLYKTQVYDLARWRNQLSPVIPERIITRAPSAELRPNQTDQDSLPPYEELDRILEAYIEHSASLCDLLAQGEDPAVLERIIRLLHCNEYKRQQGAIGPKLSAKALHADWRFPQTDRYTFEWNIAR